MLLQQVVEQVLSIPCIWEPNSLLPIVFNFSGRRHAALLTLVFCVKQGDSWHGAFIAFLRQAA